MWSESKSDFPNYFDRIYDMTWEVYMYIIHSTIASIKCHARVFASSQHEHVSLSSFSKGSLVAFFGSLTLDVLPARLFTTAACPCGALVWLCVAVAWPCVAVACPCVALVWLCVAAVALVVGGRMDDSRVNTLNRILLVVSPVFTTQSLLAEHSWGVRRVTSEAEIFCGQEE